MSDGYTTARVCPLCREAWHIHKCQSWQLADEAERLTRLNQSYQSELTDYGATVKRLHGELAAATELNKSWAQTIKAAQDNWKDRDRWRSQAEGLAATLEAMAAELATERKREVELLTWLNVYADHTSDCTKWYAEGSCSCGFRCGMPRKEALAAHDAAKDAEIERLKANARIAIDAGEVMIAEMSRERDKAKTERDQSLSLMRQYMDVAEANDAAFRKAEAERDAARKERDYWIEKKEGARAAIRTTQRCLETEASGRVAAEIEVEKLKAERDTAVRAYDVMRKIVEADRDRRQAESARLAAALENSLGVLRDCRRMWWPNAGRVTVDHKTEADALLARVEDAMVPDESAALAAYRGRVLREAADRLRASNRVGLGAAEEIIEAMAEEGKG
jgi:hypothetical protein